ncbi:hypothetical protein ACA910_008598 [Epithemia clementina (nom. ined.)]
MPNLTTVPSTPKGPTHVPMSPNSKDISIMSYDESNVIDHVLGNVLKLPDPKKQKTKDWMNYQGFDDLRELHATYLDAPDGILRDGNYKTADGDFNLPPYILQLLKNFIMWTTHFGITHQGRFPIGADLLQLSSDEFDAFRCFSASSTTIYHPSPSSGQHLNMMSPLTTGTVSHGTTPKSEYYHQLSAFKKGIKRDSAAFPIFKDDKYFDYFSRSFEAVADAQGLGDLLDPDFQPDHSDEYAIALFNEQQKFLYSVLLTNLQTDEDKSIVRAHAKDKDAQAILRELRHHYTKSAVARNEITRLTTYITNLCLDSSWRGTTESFIMHFKEQLRLLDDLQPICERLPDTMQRTLLMNAVKGVGDLRRIQNLFEYLQHKDPNHTITFEDYYSLLKNAALPTTSHRGVPNIMHVMCSSIKLMMMLIMMKSSLKINP